jgi:hypothetical protein
MVLILKTVTDRVTASIIGPCSREQNWTTELQGKDKKRQRKDINAIEKAETSIDGPNLIEEPRRGQGIKRRNESTKWTVYS